MKSKYLIALLSIFFIFIASCKDKEEPLPEISINPAELLSEKEVTKSEETSNETTAQDTRKSFHNEKAEIKIVIPDDVKKSWEAVRLSIDDKKSQKSDIVTIKLGEGYDIPDSELKIKVGAFLPDFKMDALAISSISNKPNNPAVKVSILNNGGEIFNGWLYSKYPSVHPFQHDRFAIILKEGVRKK